MLKLPEMDLIPINLLKGRLKTVLYRAAESSAYMVRPCFVVLVDV